MSEARYGNDIWDTELGKALNKVIPPETQRIIIDITYDKIVKVYYQCIAGNALLQLDWENLLKNAEVISAEKKVKGSTDD